MTSQTRTSRGTTRGCLAYGPPRAPRRGWTIRSCQGGMARQARRVCLRSIRSGVRSRPPRRPGFRFSGDEWTLKLVVDYDFAATRNGRHAYLWIVPGAAGERMSESVASVRSAALARLANHPCVGGFDSPPAPHGRLPCVEGRGRLCRCVDAAAEGPDLASVFSGATRRMINKRGDPFHSIDVLPQ